MSFCRYNHIVLSSTRLLSMTYQQSAADMTSTILLMCQQGTKMCCCHEKRLLLRNTSKSFEIFMLLFPYLYYAPCSSCKTLALHLSGKRSRSLFEVSETSNIKVSWFLVTKWSASHLNEEGFLLLLEMIFGVQHNDKMHLSVQNAQKQSLFARKTY